MKRYTIFSVLIFIAWACRGSESPFYLDAPIINYASIYKTTATVSWTAPAGATSFVLERATASNFSGATQVYSGSQQVYYATSLTENTRYYWRVKAVQGGTESVWASTTFKTFWSPTAASQGGNRIAVQADVDNATLNPDGHLNVGDYLIVGTNGGGYVVSGVPFPWGGTLFGPWLVPALAAGKKICIAGGRGWDYIQLDLSLNQRSGTDTLIITNLGGQVRAMIWLGNAKNVLLTGKYDPVRKTGSPDYQGHAGSWTDFYGKYGFYCQGWGANRSTNIMALGGQSSGVVYDFIQAGEGGFASLEVKNDSRTFQTLVIPSTGGATTYQTYTPLRSSTTSIAIPTTHPTTVNATVATGLTFIVNEYVQFANGANGFVGKITAYNTGTGAMTVATTSHTGSGTFASWSVYQLITAFVGTERIRLTRNNAGTTRINWIEFQGVGASTQTTRYQVENMDFSSGLSAIATADVDGSQDVTMTNANSYLDLQISLPMNLAGATVADKPGTYRMYIRSASTAQTDLIPKIAWSPIFNVTVRDCYFADGGSEGLYIGSTQPAPAGAIDNFSVINTIFARVGSNPVQVGNVRTGGRMQNVVNMAAAFEWSNVFQPFQDQSVQWGIRINDSWVMRDNIVTGGGENYLNVILSPGAGDHADLQAADPGYIRNNYFGRARGYHGGYISPPRFF